MVCVSVCQEADLPKVDTKTALNVQEKFRGNAYEQKWGGSWESLKDVRVECRLDPK